MSAGDRAVMKYYLNLFFVVSLLVLIILWLYDMQGRIWNINCISIIFRLQKNTQQLSLVSLEWNVRGKDIRFKIFNWEEDLKQKSQKRVLTHFLCLINHWKIDETSNWTLCVILRKPLTIKVINAKVSSENYCVKDGKFQTT